MPVLRRRPPGATLASRLGLALGVLLLACASDDSPAAPAPGDTSAECALPDQGYSPACNECLATECCAPIESCKASEGCSVQLDCAVACRFASEPGACVAACFARGRDAAYVAYDDCSFEACFEACWM